jgi:hypothetical protein
LESFGHEFKADDGDYDSCGQVQREAEVAIRDVEEFGEDRAEEITRRWHCRQDEHQPESVH